MLTTIAYQDFQVSYSSIRLLAKGITLQPHFNATIVMGMHCIHRKPNPNFIQDRMLGIRLLPLSNLLAMKDGAADTSTGGHNSHSVAT